MTADSTSPDLSQPLLGISVPAVSVVPLEADNPNKEEQVLSECYANTETGEADVVWATAVWTTAVWTI